MALQISEYSNYLLSRLPFGRPSDSYGTFRKTADSMFKRKIILLSWNSEEGQARLQSAEYKNAFYRLAHCYQAQINPFFCGVACTATALNVLQLGNNMVPVQKKFSYKTNQEEIEYRLHTQLTLLNEDTDYIKHRHVIAPSMVQEMQYALKQEFNPGLELSEVKELLEHYGAKVSLQYAQIDQNAGIEAFKQALISVLNDPVKIMIANFHGGNLGASTKGHFSTLAAYDAQTESVLVLDTAVHKNAWFWAPVDAFYKAMHIGKDKKTRGYLIVS